MSQTFGVMLFAIIIAIIGIAAIAYLVISLRRRNSPNTTENLAGKSNVPRDRTITREKPIEDTTGNYSRRVPNDTDSNS